MNFFNTFARGFAWTLGRQAATDAYRRPAQFLGVLGFILKMLFMLLLWLVGGLMIIVTLAIVFGGQPR